MRKVRLVRSASISNHDPASAARLRIRIEGMAPAQWASSGLILGWSLLVADRSGQVRWISYYSCRRGEADSNRPAVVCRPAGHQQQPQCHRSGRGRAGGLDQPDRPRLFRVSEREVALAQARRPLGWSQFICSANPSQQSDELRAGMCHARGHPATGGYRRVYYQPASSARGATAPTN